MDINNIIKKVHNREPKPMNVNYKYAVLVPMIKINNRWELIYELRSKNLKRQPGEISFPGGKVEDGETYKEAAIRETVEELKIDKNNVEVVGQLDYLVSHANSCIHSFLGRITGINIEKVKPNKAEVDHIFTVPLEFFLDTEPEVYYIDVNKETTRDFPYNLIPNGDKYNWNSGRESVYFYKYKDYIIWGYTAKVTKKFIDIIKN